MAFRLALPWLDNPRCFTSDRRIPNRFGSSPNRRLLSGWVPPLGRGHGVFPCSPLLLDFQCGEVSALRWPPSGYSRSTGCRVTKVARNVVRVERCSQFPPQYPAVITNLIANDRKSLTLIHCTAPSWQSWMTSVDRAAVGSRALILLLRYPANL